MEERREKRRKEKESYVARRKRDRRCSRLHFTTAKKSAEIEEGNKVHQVGGGGWGGALTGNWVEVGTPETAAVVILAR